MATAQGVSIGLRGGLNIAKQKISNASFSFSSSTNSLTSFVVGGYAKIMFKGKMGIQPELLYSRLGGNGGATTVKTDYLSIPVFFRYNVFRQFHLLAGPQLGLLLSAKSTDSSGTRDIMDLFNSFDFGGVVAAGVDFGPFNAGLRYNLGFSNISKDTSSGYVSKNTAFQIVVGYKLFGK